MKNSINILFVCGYGVGSSVMLKIVVEKALKERGIRCQTEHTAAGEATGYARWADIIAISKKLVDVVDLASFAGKDIIQIENLMDGNKIGQQVQDIVMAKYPAARGEA
jgi:PTS system ascorbate-specific IIB component